MKSIYLLLIVSSYGFGSCNQDVKSEEPKNTIETPEQKQKVKPKNIIFMIGDGMGLTQITAGMIAKKDNLNLERCPIIGLSKTESADNIITDSAAGATAFSTGVKTYNGAIGVGTDTLPLKNIIEIVETHNIATGLVATASITHATPASFIAHQKSRFMDQEIAADFLNTDIDVFIGGGKTHFIQREDEQNLLKQLEEKGYNIATGIEEVEAVADGKLAGFIAEGHPVKMSEGRGDVLTRATKAAINLLDHSEIGFFLMVEGSQIDWGGHANESDYIISEMLDFDNTIGAVLDFAEKNGETLVIITADHETGGYAINGGDRAEGTVDGAFTTDYHTATMVPVFAFGPGAEIFSGVYQNTAIFNKMLASYGINME